MGKFIVAFILVSLLLAVAPSYARAAPPAQTPVLSQTTYLPLIDYKEPDDLEIIFQWHFMASNHLFIFGELLNRTEVVVSPYTIDALFFDSNGVYLDSAPLFVPRDHLMPGEMTCFGNVLDGYLSPPENWSYFVLEQPEFYETGPPPELLLLSHQGVYNISDKTYRVSGAVYNDQAIDQNNVRLVATVYDEAGRVTGCASTRTNQDVLSPEETGYFEMLFTSVYRDRGNIRRYRLQID